MEEQFVIGIDFGSDSVRALVVNARDGKEVATAVTEYPRWKQGLYCDPARNQYRQHPLDYIEALEQCVREALSVSGAETAARVAGIGIDTTGSTPVLTDQEGTPLALLPAFAEVPDAMFVLWKDHTAVEEAERITQLAKSGKVDYTRYSGGSYSCESVWAKMLHCLRQAPALRESAASWMEHCDWITGLLCGDTRPASVHRSRCAAGHKALWHAAWGGLPPMDFFKQVDSLLGCFEGHLFQETYTSDQMAGRLCPEWAERLGLSAGIAVAVGYLDCHTGAGGAGITPGTAVKVIGTSSCDLVVADPQDLGERTIPGICGQVDGSIVPRLIGFEAGQAAFGDVYAWLKRFTGRDLVSLTQEAQSLPLREDDLVALDWLNGRRSPDPDPLCKGAIFGLTLGTTPAQVFKALVEATAFGSRAIYGRFQEEGFPVDKVIAVGGIARKSAYVMQTLADVLDMSLYVLDSDQACALGGAMFGAVAAGIYPDVPSAQAAMKPGCSVIYRPNPQRQAVYETLYQQYRRLGSALTF